MKILGIGNAIVDVICKVDDSFIEKNNLTKSTMKLVDEVEFKKLLTTLKIEETVSGGSVANSIVGLSQLGNNVGFIGKISDDDLGEKYEKGLKKENVNYVYQKRKELLPTGTCLILVTPDSERTMCTFLGTAGKINENDINIKAIEESYKKSVTDEFFIPTNNYSYKGIKDGDGFLITNYRADRVREILTSIFDKNFNSFERKKIQNLWN